MKYRGFLDEAAELYASQFKQSSPEGEGWISVKTRIPETCDKVLVCLSDGCILTGRIWSQGIWSAFFADGESDLTERTVDFWMPLPSPPNGDWCARIK